MIPNAQIVRSAAGPSRPGTRPRAPHVTRSPLLIPFRFLIEVLEGEKIVKRERGFTVSTCCSTAVTAGTCGAASPSPARRSQRAPTSDPSRFSPCADAGSSDPLDRQSFNSSNCAESIGTELEPVCEASCLGACNETLRKYHDEYAQRTGFEFEERKMGKMLRACTRECSKQCRKPGKIFSFSIPSKSVF